jgi:peptidoglycan/xylan/chitin deacetylase (PgdA/CDA1 family)
VPDTTSDPATGKAVPSTALPELFLTFDDGPFPTTELILDVLRKHEAKATFFVVLQRKGERSTQFRSLVRMVSEGHAIGNHGVDHDPMTKKGYLATTPAEVQKDFDDNARILAEIFTSQSQTSPGMSIARLPGDGRFNASYVEMIIKKVGVPHASWDLEFSPNGLMRHVAHVDWQGIKGLSATRPGLPTNREIALLHDSHFKGKIAIFEALIVFLKTKFQLKPMKTVPRGLTSIKYPP